MADCAVLPARDVPRLRPAAGPAGRGPAPARGGWSDAVARRVGAGGVQRRHHGYAQRGSTAHHGHKSSLSGPDIGVHHADHPDVLGRHRALAHVAGERGVLGWSFGADGNCYHLHRPASCTWCSSLRRLHVLGGCAELCFLLRSRGSSRSERSPSSISARLQELFTRPPIQWMGNCGHRQSSGCGGSGHLGLGQSSSGALAWSVECDCLAATRILSAGARGHGRFLTSQRAGESVR
mmetsp:Transcript_35493/g.68033  ORF Transcript_35493/g.68033 Transcript_35493/m.68033 type:complete len:236 (+) Transcript_35493:944-1651(+)